MNNNNFRVNLYISSGISLLLCGVGGRGEECFLCAFCAKCHGSVVVLAFLQVPSDIVWALFNVTTN